MKMTQEHAKIAIQFLMRTELRGEEVPAFNAVMQALHEIASAEHKQEA